MLSQHVPAAVYIFIQMSTPSLTLLGLIGVLALCSVQLPLRGWEEDGASTVELSAGG